METLQHAWRHAGSFGRQVERIAADRPMGQEDLRGRGLTRASIGVLEGQHEVRGLRLLQGYRGRPPADVDALRDVLLRVSRLADDLPEVLELDLNPVVVLPVGKGCRVIDARIRIA